MRRILVAGNWKMNTDRSSAMQLARDVRDGAVSSLARIDVTLCPPFPYLSTVADVLSASKVGLGAQNCYHEAPGAFTGEVAVTMLKDCGCQSVILGHSERRHVLGESDELINKKVRATLAGGLTPIFCVGELLSERQSNQTESVLDRQMEHGLAGLSADEVKKIVIAYEPVWAIGTGLTATPEQAQAAHAHLRKWLANKYDSPLAQSVRILYGGSVKAANAKSLIDQPDVDGALVGGASLIAKEFLGIIQAGVDAQGTE